MSKRLEQFVKDNREEFDPFEPGPVVWHNIQQELAKAPKQKGVYISMRLMRWMAAAAVVIVLGTGGIIFMNSKNNLPTVAKVNQEHNADNPAGDTQPNLNPGNIVVDSAPIEEKTYETPLLTQRNSNNPKPERPLKADGSLSSNDLKTYEESTKYFAQLIVNKQQELKGLEKSNPVLYKEFVNDINELDVAYKTLKKQLPQTEDPSRLLKAMIKTLQLQIDLLNKQLIIVNQIESKQKVTNYERTI